MKKGHEMFDDESPQFELLVNVALREGLTLSNYPVTLSP